MLQWFRRRAEATGRAEKFYGSVVAAARQPAFYRDLGVPDTPEGRFELVALHLFLLLEGMKAQGPGDTELSQRTIEAFVTDMDDCMREMGVGDMVVGKKVKRAAAAFYERATAYRQGLAGAGGELEDKLRTYIFMQGGSAAGGPETQHASALLARYVRQAAVLSSEEPFVDLVSRGGLSQLLASDRTESS